MSQANVCDIKEPLNPIKTYQETRADLDLSKTQRERYKILMRFASAHGLFSDHPELYNKIVIK